MDSLKHCTLKEATKRKPTVWELLQMAKTEFAKIGSCLMGEVDKAALGEPSELSAEQVEAVRRLYSIYDDLGDCISPDTKPLASAAIGAEILQAWRVPFSLVEDRIAELASLSDEELLRAVYAASIIGNAAIRNTIFFRSSRFFHRDFESVIERAINEVALDIERKVREAIASGDSADDEVEFWRAAIEDYAYLPVEEPGFVTDRVKASWPADIKVRGEVDKQDTDRV